MSNAISRMILFTIVLVGLNLRPSLASISPIISTLQAATGLSDIMIGALTTIPVFIMGVGALLIPWLHTYISIKNGVKVAACLIILGCISRFYYTYSGILIGSALLVGLGISVIQALMPGYIKNTFKQKSSLIMGLYTTAIMSGAAIASYTSPLVESKFNSQIALGIWFVPAVVALVFWVYIFSAKRASFQNAENKVKNTHFKLPPQAIVWRLCLFFGLSSGAYTLVLAWLPDYYISLGWSQIDAGGLLSLVTIAEVIAGLAISFLIDRIVRRQYVIMIAIGLMLVGLLLIIFQPLQTVYLSTLLLGLGIGALFPLSLIAAVDHAYDTQGTFFLTSLVQGFGYIIAAFFPLVAGIIKHNLSDLSYAWVGMAIISILMMLISFSFYRTTQVSN